MGLNIISNYTIGLCLLYIPIYTCTSIYTYILMVYYLLGRSDNTDRTHLTMFLEASQYRDQSTAFQEHLMRF